MRDTNEWMRIKKEKINSLMEYPFSETLSEVASKIGINAKKIVKLDQNENLFLSNTILRSFLREVVDTVDTRIYSRDEDDLKESISKYINLPKDSIIVGSGSDQLIDLFIRTFLTNKEGVISIKPTYSMYKWSANHHGVPYTEIPLEKDFSLNTDKILSSTKKDKICFLCSPNNPTGNQFNEDKVKEIIEEFWGLVIVDEAYVEYAEHSLAHLVKKYDNLVILRTFSKAFGLAGARIGYAIVNPDTATSITRFAQIPFPLTAFGSKFAIKVLEKVNIIKKSIDELKHERDRLFEKLKSINGLMPFRSDANFILFSISTPYKKTYELLLKRGILIRKIGNVLNFKNCLRTTIGLQEMNENLINSLKSCIRT